ncbi:MAG: GTP cyclohydrolase I [Bdellovibrionales bacterium]|nr:GTP cyclohydrolase I [Bdellovibrionales bacterium]
MVKHPENLETLCGNLLHEIGEDPTREGLIRTPKRYARAIADLTQGYDQNLQEIVNGAIFEENY